MQRKDLRIVYMGTPEFAVPSLEALIKAGFNVVAVVTMPDKPQGRGLKLTYSPIKRYALDNGIEILQPEKLKDEVFINRLKELNPDLGVVVAFRMLPEVVWQLPKYGTINLHGSLLPKYRGAAPINWAIINGEKETGVTTFRLQHTIDTGNILIQAKMPIAETDNAEDIHDRMMILGAKTIVDTVDLFLNEDPKGKSQDDIEEKPTSAPKLNKDNTQISFDDTSKNIYNFIRGLSPFPTAWCKININNEKTFILKVFESKVIDAPSEILSHQIGYSMVFNKNKLIVRTKDGAIELTIVQAEGKKRMNSKDFINGLRL